MRLYSCQADIVKYPRADAIVLYSYNTPVVVIKGYDIAIYRYNSSTTKQHLRKFQRWLRDNAPASLYNHYKYLLDDGTRKHATFIFNIDGVTDFVYNHDYSAFECILDLFNIK